MSENVTDGEQQIINLLEKLIERLPRDRSDDEDSIASTTNRLALAAMIISIGAFLTTMLQAMLQYADTNSSSRRKCNVSAIGRVATMKGLSKWSLRHWEKKYYYPELDMNARKILNSVKRPGSATKLQRIFGEVDHLGYTDLEDPNHIYRWEGRLFADVSWEKTSDRDLIEDGYLVLRRQRKLDYMPWEFVRAPDLPWRLRLRWAIYRHFNSPHHPKKYRPRASWAQLLEELDVEEFRSTFQLPIDADCIPSMLDVPTQSINFRELALLAFFIGLDIVEINREDSRFNARSSIGAITTEELPGFGKLVRFQKYGSFGTLPYIIFYSSLKHALEKQLRGSSDRGYMNQYIEEATIMRESLAAGSLDSDVGKWKLFLKESTRLGYVLKHNHWPIITFSAAFNSIPSLIGYPARLIIKPFIPLFARLAEGVIVKLNETYSAWDDFALSSNNIELRRLLVFHFHRDDNLMSGSLHSFFQVSFPVWTRFISAVPKLESELLSMRSPHSKLEQSYSLRGCYVIHGGQVLPLLLSLLRNFDPTDWAMKMTTKKHDPKKYLWTQLILLDILIAKTVNEIQPRSRYERQIHLKYEGLFVWEFGRLGQLLDHNMEKILSAIAHAIIRALKEPGGTHPLQFLHVSLQEELYGNDRITHTDRFRIMYLADLFRLRVLFYIALVTILPDSSDLASLFHSRETIILPMI